MRQKLPPTFPIRVIFVVSLVLCLCGVGTIILAVFSVKHHSWGYNWGTGFWCGAVTLAAGVCGIVSTHARDICSMKIFMISAVFGGVISLVMLALSAGGLDSSSGMYADTYRPNTMTIIVHGGCLGISLLQLILFILADGICIYHLFVENKSTMFSLKTTPGNKTTAVLHRDSTRLSNTSNSSSAPIYRKPRSKDKNKKKKHKSTSQSENFDDLETPLRRNRDSLLAPRRQEGLRNSSPVRNHNERNSFTTFGHSSVAEQESLIVQPDDDVSTVNNTVRNGSRASTNVENHYAQAMLFEPPIPIEDDEHLPPYEVFDSNPYKIANLAASESRCSQRRNKNSSGRRDSSRLSSSNELSRTGDQTNKQRSRINTRNEIPHGRGDNANTQRSNTALEAASTEYAIVPVYAIVQPRRSRSTDLLMEEPTSNTADKGQTHPQGVVFKDFARSNDEINPRSQRSQSLRSVGPNREKRLERRNRALSAEIKLTKDLVLYQGEQCNLMQRTASIDGSNSGLYAFNRVMPTKFSLRTPVRQVGAPYVPSAVPIKSISTLPIFRPPPKPPRTHSVTVEDLKSDTEDNVLENNTATEDVTECVFIDEGTSKDDALVKTDQQIALKNDNVLENNTDTSDVTDFVFIDEGTSKDDVFVKKTDQQIALKNISKDKPDEICNAEKASANVTISQMQITENDISNEQLKEKETSSAKEQAVACHDMQNVAGEIKSEMKLQEGPIVSCLTKPPLTKQFDLKAAPPFDTSNGDSKLKDETAERANNENGAELQDSMRLDAAPVIKRSEAVHVPMPKARTSIKSSSSISKSLEFGTKPYLKQSVKEKEDSTCDSHAAVKNNKSEDKVKQSQLNSDDFSVLKVNLPPLKKVSIGSTSPSLRIINRNVPKKENDNKAGQSHEVTNTVVENVHMAFKDSPNINSVSRSQSVEYNGARPKTTPRTSYSMSDKSRALPFSNRNFVNRDNISSHRKGNGDKVEGAKTRSGIPSKSSQSVQKQPSFSRSYINAKLPEVNSNRPVPSVRNGSAFSSNSSVLSPNLTPSVITPVRTSSAAGGTGYSQGVLHLPQTQFSRQVSPSESQTSGTNSVSNNVPVTAQNPGNQQNINTDSLLISKLL